MVSVDGEQNTRTEQNLTDPISRIRKTAPPGLSIFSMLLDILMLSSLDYKIRSCLGRLRRVDLITWVRCPSVRTQKVFPIPMKFGM